VSEVASSVETGLHLGYAFGVMTYTIAIHAEPTGGYWAEVPALPGCFSQGETMPELKANIREAIELYLETLRAEGRQPDPDVQILEVAV
jgi:predicted RNase H-like HicB family nuclease